MDFHVGVIQTESSEPPSVVLQLGDGEVVFPWPAWEMLVHKASAKYVLWALSHPEEYAALEAHMASLGGPELVQIRYHALTG